MEQAATVLVIILAILLIVFLLLGIILAVLMIRISKQIRQIADKADLKIGTVSSLIGGLGQFTTATATVKLVLGLLTKMKKGKKYGERK